MPDTSRGNEQQGLCLLKRAIRALLKKHPEGMTHEELCRRLKRQVNFPGTYRNLLSQANSILGMLIEEGKIRRRGDGPARIYVPVR